jgi:hypothetical protein
LSGVGDNALSAVSDVVFIAVVNAAAVNVVLNIFLGNVTDLNTGCE